MAISDRVVRIPMLPCRWQPTLRSRRPVRLDPPDRTSPRSTSETPCALPVSAFSALHFPYSIVLSFSDDSGITCSTSQCSSPARRNGRWGDAAVVVCSPQGDVAALAHHLEAKFAQGANDLPPRRVLRERCHGLAGHSLPRRRTPRRLVSRRPAVPPSRTSRHRYAIAERTSSRAA